MKTILLFLLVAVSLSGKAQTFNVDTLQYSGNPNKRINLVFVADGYTTANLTQFKNDAVTMSNYLLNSSPYSFYKNYFNVFIINVNSTQAGASHPGTATDVTEPVIPVVSINNYFGSSFDSYSIHRLLVPTNYSGLSNVLAANTPTYDQVIVIVNSTEYGGSGGTYATTSINSSSSEIMVHEMGHSFAGLADEYWAGPSYAMEKPNMTATSNTTTVKWSPWVGINSIGVYAHGTTSPQSLWFRPHQNCKMRYLGVPFCSVCQEAIIEKIHSLTNPIDSFIPANTGTVTAPLTPLLFKSFLLKPAPNTLKSTWSLNSTTIASNKDSVSINNASFNTGNNTVSITVIDTNTFSKSATHPSLHTFSVVWTVTKTLNGIINYANILQLSTFPNPVTDVLSIKYTLQKESDVEFEIRTAEGKKMASVKEKNQTTGEHEQKIDLNNLANGTYFLQCVIDKKVILNKILVTK